jgi:hypothetical protein
MILMAALIATTASFTCVSIGSDCEKSCSVKVASKNRIKTQLNSPLCHVPHGKWRVLSQPMHSLEIFWMWALYLFLKHHPLYRADKASKRSSTVDPFSCMDSRAKAPPHKFLATPR